MSQVTFYLMSQPDDADASAVERLACQLAADGWSAGHLYLLCEDEAQSLRLDELLWQLPPDRFVPHQLRGERSGPGGDRQSAATAALCLPHQPGPADTFVCRTLLPSGRFCPH